MYVAGGLPLVFCCSFWGCLKATEESVYPVGTCAKHKANRGWAVLQSAAMENMLHDNELTRNMHVLSSSFTLSVDANTLYEI